MDVLKILKVILIALLLFLMGSFLVGNAGSESLGYQINFVLKTPPFADWNLGTYTVGFLLVVAFTKGMFLTILIGGLHLFQKRRELAAKDFRLKELLEEKEELSDQLAYLKNRGLQSSSQSIGQSQLPENPKVE